MSMVYCRGCAKELHESAPSCPGCGAVQNIRPGAFAQSASNGDSEPISEAWKAKFALVEKAGGVKLPQLKMLSFGERMKALFNVWAFLFGPIYYLIKGMWKKALSLTGLSILIVVVLEVICQALGFSGGITNFVAAGVFSRRANIDYYKKVKLADNNWW